MVARAGRSVLVFEAENVIGGGARSAELTLPGFVHDVCSAVHPLAAASPFFRELPLAEYGLEWISPPTAAGLGGDAEAYRKLFEPITQNWERLLVDFLAPPRLPAHPLAMLAFGRRALRSARAVADKHFRDVKARALFAGLAAHAMLPLEYSLTAGF